jgi:hypothetical protein
MRRKPTVMPEKVLRGGGVPRGPRVQPIRWAVWLALPHLELWQAVALSLRVNPADELRDQVSHPPSMFSRLPAEFFERLSYCKKALGGPIRTQGNPYWDRAACSVSRVDVVAFLTSAGYEVAEELRDGLPPSGTQGKQPLQRWPAQESEILRVLHKLGHDPRALPKHSPGIPGAKTAAKRALGSTGMWARAEVFDKAWERLRKSGRIADRG